MLRGQIQKFSEKFNKTLDKGNHTCYNKDNEDTTFLEFIIKTPFFPEKARRRQPTGFVLC